LQHTSLWIIKSIIARMTQIFSANNIHRTLIKNGSY
jgi:hypothetical protein